MIRVRAPLRLPLGGGGTDLPSYYSRRGGFLIAAALRDAVTVTLRARARSVGRGEDARPLVPDSFMAQALRHLGCPPDVEVEIEADAPPGCGLGGSGALLVALAHALHLWRGEKPSPRRLAEEAFRIERHRMGRPVGLQDPYLAAYGGLLELRIGRSGHAAVRRLRAPRALVRRLERSLLLADTGRRRDAAKLLRGLERRAASRVDTLAGLDAIRSLGRRIAQLLSGGGRAGRHTGLGALLRRHWEIKRELDPAIESPEAGRCLALGEAAGARGGKLIGAGGGGFVLLECGARRGAVRRALQDAGFACRAVRLDLQGSRACPAAACRARAA